MTQSIKDKYMYAFLGMPGQQGARGPEGVQGAAGELGNKGEQGDKGVPGARGLPGSQGQTVSIYIPVTYLYYHLLFI